MDTKILDCFAIIFCSIAFLEGLQSLDLDHSKMRQDHLYQQQNDFKKLMVQKQGSKGLAGSKRYVLDKNNAVYQPHMGNKLKEKVILFS